MRRIRHQQGFTLVEIIWVLSIIVLLAALGLPTYGNLVARHRLNAATVQVMSDLMQARKRALSQQHSVQVIFYGSQKYRIWNDYNDNNRINRSRRGRGVDEIDYKDIISFGAKMKSKRHPRFWPSGNVTNLTTIKLKHPGVSNQNARCITISITGRIKQARCIY